MSATHVVISLETLSRRPEAQVVAIAACQLMQPGTEEKHRPLFYDTFSELGQKHRDVNKNIMTWWDSQGPSAQYLLETFRNETLRSNKETLECFRSFCKRLAPEENLSVWSERASIDLAILKSLHADLNMNTPWLSGKEFCISTVKRLVDGGASFSSPLRYESNVIENTLQLARYLESLIEYKAFTPLVKAQGPFCVKCGGASLQLEPRTAEESATLEVNNWRRQNQGLVIRDEDFPLRYQCNSCGCRFKVQEILGE